MRNQDLSLVVTLVIMVIVIVVAATVIFVVIHKGNRNEIPTVGTASSL